MAARSLTWWVCAFAVLASGCTCAPSDDVLAQIESARGEVERDEARAVGRWQHARPGDALRLGDGVRTGEGAHAVVRLSAGGLVRVAPDSELRLVAASDAVQVVAGLAEIEAQEGAVLHTEFGLARVIGRGRVRARVSPRGARFELVAGEGVLERVGRGAERLRSGTPREITADGLAHAEAPIAPSAPIATAALAIAERAADAPVADVPVNAAAPQIRAGESPYVHAVAPVSVRIAPPERCERPSIEVDGRAVDSPIVRLDRGDHAYVVRCGEATVAGTIRVRADLGRSAQRTRRVVRVALEADGREYGVLHEVGIPQVAVRWPGAPPASSYELVVSGRQTLRERSETASFVLAPGALRSGRYRFRVVAENGARSPDSTLSLQVEAPPSGAVLNAPADRGFAAGERVVARGAAPPGWRVEIGGAEVALDSRGRFERALIAGDVLDARFVDPRGVAHYVPRRSRGARDEH